MPNENLSLDTESTEYIFFGKMATFGAAKSLSRGVSYSFPLWKEIEYSAATAGGHGGKIILFFSWPISILSPAKNYLLLVSISLSLHNRKCRIAFLLKLHFLYLSELILLLVKEFKSSLPRTANACFAKIYHWSTFHTQALHLNGAYCV